VLSVAASARVNSCPELVVPGRALLHATKRASHDEVGEIVRAVRGNARSEERGAALRAASSGSAM
jgi:hypothetical protein